MAAPPADMLPLFQPLNFFRDRSDNHPRGVGRGAVGCGLSGHHDARLSRQPVMGDAEVYCLAENVYKNVKTGDSQRDEAGRTGNSARV